MAILSLLVIASVVALAASQSSLSSTSLAPSSTSTCSKPAVRLHLPDPPQDNYFYSDCQSSSHVIVTSPLPGSNLSVVRPRLIIAWPAGNSGAMALFAPENNVNGSLSIHLQNSTISGKTLDPVHDSGQVGVSGLLSLNNTARLTTSILGSIRTIRDFTEGGGILNDDFQTGLEFSLGDDGSSTINRTWLDGVTTTWLTFTPLDGIQAVSCSTALIEYKVLHRKYIRMFELEVQMC